MKYLVCGGRNFGNINVKKDTTLYKSRMKEYKFVIECLYDKIESDPFSSIISGGAHGPDSIAEIIAKDLNIDFKKFPAQWDIYGKSAGWHRNNLMADQNPDYVLAFPGGAGTQMMIDIAKKRNIETIIYEINDEK